MIHDNYNHIANPIMRTYNRMRTAMNIRESIGFAPASKYISQFSEEDRKKISWVFAYYQKHGHDAMIRFINKNVVVGG